MRPCLTRYWKIYYSSPQPHGQPFLVQFLQASLCICWSEPARFRYFLFFCWPFLELKTIFYVDYEQVSLFAKDIFHFIKVSPTPGMSLTQKWTSLVVLRFTKKISDNLFRLASFRAHLVLFSVQKSVVTDAILSLNDLSVWKSHSNCQGNVKRKLLLMEAWVWALQTPHTVYICRA